MTRPFPSSTLGSRMDLPMACVNGSCVLAGETVYVAHRYELGQWTAVADPPVCPSCRAELRPLT